MSNRTVTEGTILWQPSEHFVKGSNMTRYMNWLRDQKGLNFEGYHDLWEWSVTDLEAFWESIWDFFKIKASKPYKQVLSERRMPGAEWFSGAELNYAEHVFRNRSSARSALMFQSEFRSLAEISWDEMHSQVASVAAALRNMGVKRGDRVVSNMPNIPQTIIAFLATASVGAIWSSCSPDFGTRSIVDRLKQIEPKVLFVVNGYRYGGKPFDRLSATLELQKALDTVENIIHVPYLPEASTADQVKGAVSWDALLTTDKADLVFEQVPFSHPLWVVYSSGTTGLPKGLVHSHGGILIELLKHLIIQNDVKPGDRFFWFSTTGWVMWNVLQASLLTGATAILYDGNPGYPSMDVLWKLAEEARITLFGTSAAFITACMNAGMTPRKDHNLGNLKAVGSTGSPLSPEGFKWVYDSVKSDVWLGSMSGGTDPCTAFLGCSALLPVHAGELQCRCLGVKAEAFDEKGKSIVNQVGELVITEPMPSMPLYLWNDPENKRYQESYFEMYPAVWRHGDWVKITERGSGIILGRSDSTLNRLGVRMGSAEIYRSLEDMPEIADSLIVGFEPKTGGYFMPLFVVLNKGATLDDDLKKKINTKIRSTLSPRHVPDAIFAIESVPKTLNGKKLEVPVRKILMGVPLEKAVNVDSMENPKAIDYFVDMVKAGVKISSQY